MITSDLKVRLARRADERGIADLMYAESNVHRHLDWRGPLEWLGGPDYWVLEEGGRVLAALACPQDPPGIAWVRLFAFAEPLTAFEAWSALWETAIAAVAAEGGALLAAISVRPWIHDLLTHSGFEVTQQIVLLEWPAQKFDRRPVPDGLRLRAMKAGDLRRVAEVDADAFDALWVNSEDSLRRAFAQATSASVAEEAGRMVGYQISTGNPLGGHLGRLAVRKGSQGRGIGEALIGEVMGKMQAQGLWRLTVNTQADNAASLKLYERMGFARTGEVFPVFTRRVEGSPLPALPSPGGTSHILRI
jgi:ribosomal protein S18 acetylase RimI-like enzyme